MKIEIRKETEKDYFETEKMVRESFWNKYQPGCNEHYMVHLMRKHPVWLPELSRIAVVDGEIAGVIMYFKAKIIQADAAIHDSTDGAENKKEVEIAAFGPLCVSHKYRNLGIGKKLMKETLALVKDAGFPGVLIVGEPDYYPKVGFIRCKDRGITDAEGNSWDAYMVYESEKGSMNIPGVFDEPYDITEGIPPVPPAEYENQFEDWTRAALPCQFEYPSPCDENNDYHLRREEESPAAFSQFFAKAGDAGTTAQKILANPLMAEFVIEKGNQQIGMCVISSTGAKPEISHIYLEEEFRAKGIEEDIQKTLEKTNKN